MKCEWCGSAQIMEGKGRVYWELPDGTRAIEILETPTIHCNACQMIYQTDQIVKQIEDQLFLINTKEINRTIMFPDLMKMPRLLKRNYFDFT
jgi:uncharacterized YokU family protein